MEVRVQGPRIRGLINCGCGFLRNTSGGSGLRVVDVWGRVLRFACGLW